MINRLVFLLSLCPLFSALAAQPNILWFVVDDMSPSFGCYGETLIQTPAVDKLAAEGTKFTRAYVTAPVCSTCRSALITGMYQTTIGAHHHRSGRGEMKIHLPPEVTPVPELFQKAGYYTCIGSGLPGFDHRGMPFTGGKGKKKAGGGSRLGKTDYNFEWDPKMYDSHDWEGHGDKPFFMQVQLHGGKLREGDEKARAAFKQRVIAELGSATDPEKVTLPSYYPRDPVILDDWALYLDAARMTDQHVGRVIARLEKEGLLENTFIIFMTDHGISHARGKQFLYDEGTHIPFVVRGPGIAKGAVRDDLVMQIDMAAMSLAAAGISIPPSMQGRDILAKDYQPRDAIFAARDRCDETVEYLRSVRTDRFLYIRNFLPLRPHLQPNAYKDGKAIVQTLRSLHAEGKLPSVSEDLLFSPTRPTEELYDYHADPFQVTNLAANPDFKAELEARRAQLDRWIVESGDKGPESEAMYDSDMVEYTKKKNPEVEKNIALMKQWAKEGK
ncbi:sulfatase [Prosthecobacter sp.]|uniref:sulfatase family protein n=1 Tax=Prosthecobacter sp. TaxID=1965333 RepID=UPI0025DFB6B4|nr:sulfatase [Prosthecobacter sp.]